MRRPIERRCNYSPRDMHEDRMKNLPKLIEDAQHDYDLGVMSVEMKKNALDKLNKEYERLDEQLNGWKKNSLRSCRDTI